MPLTRVRDRACPCNIPSANRDAAGRVEARGGAGAVLEPGQARAGEGGHGPLARDLADAGGARRGGVTGGAGTRDAVDAGVCARVCARTRAHTRTQRLTEYRRNFIPIFLCGMPAASGRDEGRGGEGRRRTAFVRACMWFVGEHVRACLRAKTGGCEVHRRAGRRLPMLGIRMRVACVLNACASNTCLLNTCV
jgi:hypothetical protein